MPFHGAFTQLLARLLIVCSFGLAGCSQQQERQAEAGQREPAAPTQIAWPAVTAVLDGTDVVDLKDLSLVPFRIEGIAGKYDSDQGGAEVTLSVRQKGVVLEIERRYSEPAQRALAKAYQFTRAMQEGSVSTDRSAFLRKTTEGLLMLESHSGVGSISPTYWVYYRRHLAAARDMRTN